ncbi:hypothetical protein B0J17DRAFT_725681 [Rhizoctonia solani]|nr:hypothetical protein B0J17DRAFT_725681 [Rhizoctonia solani]
MRAITNDPIYHAMKRWEDARDLLSGALAGYLESCLSLNTLLGRDYANARDIAPGIDSTLETLHPAMGLQLSQSTSVLSQTRNRLVSSISCLPEEILCQIFMDVVYAPENTRLSMKKCVRAMYRDLHKLLAVCSVWRNIAISLGAFWETVPVIDDPIRSRAIDLSLERSHGALRLAATTTLDGPPRLIQTVIEHASRFHALNLKASFSSQITSIATHLLRNGALTQLSELFIRCSPPKYSQPPRISNCIIEAGSPDQVTFRKLIGSLSVLRLSGIQIHWKTSACFSDRLVELYVHKVGLGSSDSSMVTFLSAISSASKLRDLKIINARTYRNPTEDTKLTTLPMVVFPRLQSLLLQDLCFNVLEFFLLNIAPGSYHSTLILSDDVFKVTYSDWTSERISLDNVTRLLALRKIDTLFLPRGPVDRKPLLEGSGLRRLLESIPKLRELTMHGWHFYEGFCNGLCPPLVSRLQSCEFSFPRLELIQLMGIRIRDQEQLKRILVALSPQTMVLSGYVRSKDEKWIQLTEGDAVVEWLKSQYP